MPTLIKGGALVDDRWTLLREVTTLAEVPSGGPIIVPLALWRLEHVSLSSRYEVGVWLKPDDDPDALAADLGRLPLVAIDFPKFTDGRGYSIARLLREKYHYEGELRAIGDVLRDQLYYLHACGFDSFALRAHRDPGQALASLGDFSDNYQATVTRPVPLFRRRGARVAGDVVELDRSEPR